MPCLGGTEGALQLHDGIKHLIMPLRDGAGFCDVPKDVDTIWASYKTPQRQIHPGFLSSTWTWVGQPVKLIKLLGYVYLQSNGKMTRKMKGA